MPDRPASLRVWLLIAMLATATATIAIASSFGAPGIAVATVVAILLIGEAWLAATMFSRTVRKPISRAIETVDRLATGDFSARMGISGPEEFAHLSRAVDGVAGRLQQADTEQKRFLADLAHRDRHAAQRGVRVRLRAGRPERGTAAERAEAADIVVRESGRLRQLLDDLRHLHRLELSESVRQEQVDIGALCTETGQRFRLAAEEAGVTLLVCAERLSVVTDPRLTDTVLNNFVSNAIHLQDPDPALGRIGLDAGDDPEPWRFFDRRQLHCRRRQHGWQRVGGGPVLRRQREKNMAIHCC